ACKLRINTVVHSPFVDPCETQFRRDVAAIFAACTHLIVCGTTSVNPCFSLLLY
ncbi:hypothetical protein BU15DRAFT_44267, partial [Melanogaster broomeanus]